MEDKAKILEKIKKLMKLSQSANMNEAGLALERAKELMDKYQITASDVVLSDVKEHSAALLKAGTLTEYQSILVSSIGTLFSCETTLGYKYDVVKGRYKCHPNFIGVAPNPEIAAYCFDVLSKSLEQARAGYISVLGRRVKPKNKTKRGNDFAEGWVLGVYSTVKKLVPERRVPKIVDEFIEKQRETGKLKGSAKVRESNGSTNPMDQLKGYSEGSKVELRHGMGASATLGLTE